eukprot:5307457-Karenia_brevis.AAC.1
MLSGQHFYGHDQSARAQQGYTVNQACIALDEKTGTNRVMLQAAGASSVEYFNLTPKEEKVFDAARNKDVQGLFDLGAHRLLSVAESFHP